MPADSGVRVVFRGGDRVKMALESFLYGSQGLSYILYAACPASDAINDVVCLAMDVCLCFVLLVGDKAGDVSSSVDFGTIPASEVFAERGSRYGAQSVGGSGPTRARTSMSPRLGGFRCPKMILFLWISWVVFDLKSVSQFSLIIC
jgi:hypothetical protein